MKYGPLLVLFAAIAFSSAALAQSAPAKRGLVDHAVVDQASPAQRDAFGACVEQAVKQCTLPKCEAGAKEQAESCMAPWGQCRAAKVKACSERTLGNTSR